METNVFDLESAPLPDLISRIHRLRPFDAKEVKTGNYGPEKAAEKIEAARKAHIGKIKSEAQPDPLLSYVCAIGIKSEKGGTVMEFAPDPTAEVGLLQWFWKRMAASWTNEYTRWVGFNSNEFDIPYLFKRSWLQGCHPHYSCYRGRWLDDRLVDLRQKWTHYERYAKGALVDVAQALGVADPARPHDVEGKDFYKVLATNPEKAKAYLQADLNETLDIANTILNPLR